MFAKNKARKRGQPQSPGAGVVTLKGEWIEATDPASGHKYWPVQRVHEQMFTLLFF